MQETQVRSLGQDDPYRINGNPLQYSSLQNSMDRGAWWATVHGVPKSQTWLSRSSRLYFNRGAWFSPGYWGNSSCCLSVSRPFGSLHAFVYKFWLSKRFYRLFLLFYDWKELTKHRNYLFFESLNKSPMKPSGTFVGQDFLKLLPLSLVISPFKFSSYLSIDCGLGYFPWKSFISFLYLSESA